MNPQWTYAPNLLDATLNQEGALVFIQPRPHYCDRGHFSLGFQSVRFHADPVTGRAVEPSLYHHDADVAVSEGALWAQWLVGKQNVSVDEESLPTSDRMTWGRTYIKDENEVPCVVFKGILNGQTPLAVISERMVDEVRIWSLDVEGVPDLDEADVFPRHFLRLEHAALEAESFFKWRLLKQPTVGRRLEDFKGQTLPVEPIDVLEQASMPSSGSPKPKK